MLSQEEIERWIIYALVIVHLCGPHTKNESGLGHL